MRTIDLRQAVNRVYHPCLDDQSRFLVLYGGAGSGKSWFAAQKILFRIITEPGHKMICTRKVARTLHHSVWALLKTLIDQWDVGEWFKRRKTDLTIEFTPNGNEILCMGLDDREKIKSIAGVTGFWHEEPTELTPEDFAQLNLRLRGETPHYKQHILTFNPISDRHWLKKRFFETPEPQARVLKTTYQDNARIDDEYKRELENLVHIDQSLHTIYAKGDWGALTGLIYEPFRVTARPAAFDEVIYGLDFGFNNPTALIRIDLKDGEVWLTECVYQRKLTTRDVIACLTAEGVERHTPIYADAAEPDRIEEIYQAGYNILPADKGPGSVGAGIAFVRSLTLHTRPENENINLENKTYKWREDKSGRFLDEPVKYADHAMDAIRYALYSHLGKTRAGYFGKTNHTVRPT